MSAILQVDKGNLSHNYAEIATAIKYSDFIAIDTEFSGLKYYHDHFPGIFKFDSNQDAYEKMAFVADHYSLFQVGISTYKYSAEKGRYVEQNFSFLIHPAGEEPKIWNGGSVNFLAKYKFDFNKCFAKGLPIFQLNKVEDLKALLKSDDHLDDLYRHFLKSEINAKESSKMYLSKHFSKPAIDEFDSVIERASQMADKQETSLKFELLVNDTWTILSDPKNKAVNDLKEKNWISFSLKKKGNVSTVEIKRKGAGGGSEKSKEKTGESNKNSQKSTPAKSEITEDTIVKDQDEESSETKTELKVEENDETPKNDKADKSDAEFSRLKLKLLSEKAGFSLIFLEILKSKKQLIGHCCLFDWLYIFKNCFDDLPEKVEDFFAILTSSFESVWDTKYLAEVASKIDPSINPTLAKLYQYIKNTTTDKFDLVSRAEFSEDLQHDAGYDSSITGFCFIYLIYTIGISKKSLVQAAETDGNDLSIYSPIFKASEFANLVQESNKFKNVNPYRMLDLMNLEQGGENQDEVIWCMIDSSLNEGKLRCLIRDIQDHILENWSIQVHKLTVNEFYIHILDGDEKAVHDAIKSLNERFKDNVKFTDYANRDKCNLDRFWINRFK